MFYSIVTIKNIEITISGRNVKDLSLDFYLILFKCENKCKFITKGMAVELPPNTRYTC